jgi:hypothetical protein
MVRVSPDAAAWSGCLFPAGRDGLTATFGWSLED